MSDSVNEYGLGASDTQDTAPVSPEVQSDPLAHGLGAREMADDKHAGEDIPEGGPHNRLEHGLGAEGFDDNPVVKDSDPLQHGLGSPDAP